MHYNTTATFKTNPNLLMGPITLVYIYYIHTIHILKINEIYSDAERKTFPKISSYQRVNKTMKPVFQNLRHGWFSEKIIFGDIKLQFHMDDRPEHMKIYVASQIPGYLWI